MAGTGTIGSSSIFTDKKWQVSEEKAAGWMAADIDTSGWARPVILGKMGDQPWGDVFAK